MVMDQTEKLISLVHERKHLWDRSLKTHANKSKVYDIWEEIAAEMRIDEMTVRRRWRSLRDTFVKELKKIPQYDRIEAEEMFNHTKYTSWPYFELMLFIKDHVKPKSELTDPLVAESAAIESDDPLSHGITSVDVDGGNNMKEIVSTIPVQQSSSSSKGSKRQLIATEERVRERLPVTEKGDKPYHAFDEDEAFFDSLLPHVRKLRPEEKLHFQIEMQSLVHQHVYCKNADMNDHQNENSML
ncbi:uncharacterized protein LOC129755620 [Uranotaenia lowii]|uniref:uncharacterized protein LOC129755620 n=1 Tax=Uranotaenia lowii TaxID=190385 RepID=UPI002478E96E|nr:uncharacterized protein LOC129755620 [Uranotaenia lowii]XP_055608193.1 uncharacterized protein LOC129755620 [Uranotaenia lowii]